jgi:CRISPR-associated endonuclease/helicase Cas3
MANDVDLRVWGKERGLGAPYPLVWHLVDAAAAACVLWEEYLTGSQRAVVAAGLGLPQADAQKVLAFLTGLHDIGKCTAGFQRGHAPSFEGLVRGGYEDPGGDGRLGHARASQLLAYSLLCSLGYGEGVSPKRTAAYRAAQVLGGHHGRFQQDVDLGYLGDPLGTVPQLVGRSWLVQRQLMVDALHQVVGRPQAPAAVRAELSLPALVLVTGVVILADWLVSQESFLIGRQLQAGEDTSSVGVSAHFTYTRGSVPGLLVSAGLGGSALRGGDFGTVFGVEPNALQRSLVQELVPRVGGGPGLLIVTAAPGEGKTEAALHAAQVLASGGGSTGCFFALPTMATSDQMYRRVRRYLASQAADATSLTLLHSMAWLNPQYATVLSEAEDGGVVSGEDVADGSQRVLASDWLRGPKRGLLADWAVGTIDQALLSMLPVPHNTLRLLGISRKVLVVDEAHAYDWYMQLLLRRLLAWCGRLGCSVVLLSATLPSSVSRSLAEAYLRGAGHREIAPADLAVPYPGWLFVPSDGSPVVRPGAVSLAAMERSRPTRLAVQLVPVRHQGYDGEQPPPGSRLAVLRDALAVIGSGGGCAAVICNTVADAQATFTDLTRWAADQPTRPDVYLLHARFPAWQRQEITETVTTLFGKKIGQGRPSASVVVATQVIEQSLDLDFDIVVSDLAPVALLLQRAGRCWRHPVARRPAGIAGPVLVVLDPVDATGQHVRPPHWGEVYDRYLLRRTHDLLTQRRGAAIEVPGHVQDLVEQVYCARTTDGPSFLSDDEQQLREWEEHEGRRLAHQQLATLNAISEPAMLTDLRTLSKDDITDDRPPTRLGADSCRVVPCYIREDGSRWLDPEATAVPLPQRPAGRRFSPPELALIMQHTIAVRQDEVQNAGPAHVPPALWRDHFLLSELLLLPHRPHVGSTSPQPVGDLPFRLDARLGLVKQKVSEGRG